MERCLWYHRHLSPIGSVRRSPPAVLPRPPRSFVRPSAGLSPLPAVGGGPGVGRVVRRASPASRPSPKPPPKPMTSQDTGWLNGAG